MQLFNLGINSIHLLTDKWYDGHKADFSDLPAGINYADIAALALAKNVEVFLQGRKIRIVIDRTGRFKYEAKAFIDIQGISVRVHGNARSDAIDRCCKR